jgi:hypothetical protein
VFKTKFSLLSVAVAVALAACGGGGSSSTASPSPSPASPSAGKVVDGYLSGATVFCDTNKNGVLDTGEAKTTTDTSGNFTFSPGCEATLVALGGTDATTKHAFKGTLKAPAGSAVTTPLTSLIADTGMTGAQLVKALGLDADTDTTKLDPADGQHQSLRKKTLAVQQIVQRLANTFANRLGSTDTAAVYSKVGAALAKSLPASPNAPLISATGTVDISVVKAAATEALAALKADPKYASITFSAAELAACAEEIGAEAERFSTASDADLDDLAKNLQDPAAAPIDTGATTKFLALQNNALKINGSAVTYASLAAGATITTPTTLGLDFQVIGSPVIDTVAKLALELVEVGGESRVLQLMIDKVNIKNVNGQLSIAPDATAKVYVYGHTGSGIDINITLNDLAFKPITVINNSLTLNYKAMVDKVLLSVDNTTKTTAQKFTSITGQFKIKVAIDGLRVRNSDGVSALPATAIRITGSSPAQSVVGVGVSGTLIIQ